MEENEGEKKWENCNSIIHKIYLRKKKEVRTVVILEGKAESWLGRVLRELSGVTEMFYMLI